jgi:periplasmic divalent cation tolerance protein
MIVRKNKFCIVKTTFNNKKDAKKLANLLIQQKLVACAQIEEIESLYFWEEKIVDEKEFCLSLKTISKNYKKIEKLILANHNYRIPQIIQIPISDGLRGYLDWIEARAKK